MGLVCIIRLSLVSKPTVVRLVQPHSYSHCWPFPAFFSGSLPRTVCDCRCWMCRFVFVVNKFLSFSSRACDIFVSRDAWCAWLLVLLLSCKRLNSSGAGTNLKVGGEGTRPAPSRLKNLLLLCPSTFFGSRVKLVVLLIAFVMVSKVWSVSCLLFFRLTVPPPCVHPFVTVVARAPVSYGVGAGA